MDSVGNLVLPKSKIVKKLEDFRKKIPQPDPKYLILILVGCLSGVTRGIANMPPVTIVSATYSIISGSMIFIAIIYLLTITGFIDKNSYMINLIMMTVGEVLAYILVRVIFYNFDAIELLPMSIPCFITVFYFDISSKMFK
jgi:hypothetical protein